MMFEAYKFEPTPAATALLTNPLHHTASCRGVEDPTAAKEVCYCDLPAHVKEIQDEAMAVAFDRAIKMLTDLRSPR